MNLVDRQVQLLGHCLDDFGVDALFIKCSRYNKFQVGSSIWQKRKNINHNLVSPNLVKLAFGLVLLQLSLLPLAAFENGAFHKGGQK
jgi:hypothetical protein